MLTEHYRLTRGFTLVEILVAMVILSIMASLAYGSIASLRRAYEATRDEETRLREVEYAVHSISSDWMQLDQEPVRDSLGERTLPALQVDARTLDWFTLTHGGVGHGLLNNRGTQTRVTYRLEGKRLIRETMPVLHAAQSTLPTRRVLLDRVQSVALKLDDGHGGWETQWPLPNTLGAPDLAARSRPSLVEFTLVLEDIGTIHRLVEVAH
jgi:general secretion pathway protein J